MLSPNSSFISTYVPDRTLLTIFAGKGSAPGDRHMPAWNGTAEVMGEAEVCGGIPAAATVSAGTGRLENGCNTSALEFSGNTVQGVSRTVPNIRSGEFKGTDVSTENGGMTSKPHPEHPIIMS